VRLVHALLDRVPGLLAPGGALVAKVFEGEAYPDLLARVKELFETVKGFKPKASRDESREMFIVAKGRVASIAGESESARRSDHS
jgi:23S rRNA (uridine2552-2'-O)-methyltransferase